MVVHSVVCILSPIMFLELVQKPTIEVHREKEQGAVPRPGAVVTAKVRNFQYPMSASNF